MKPASGGAQRIVVPSKAWTSNEMYPEGVCSIKGIKGVYVMAKNVAELLVERLIDWEVDTIFGFPGDGINGIFEAIGLDRTRSNSSKFDMRKQLLSPLAVIRSIPVDWESAWQHQVLAASIY